MSSLAYRYQKQNSLDKTNSTEVGHELIKQGARVNSQANDDITPLMIAAYHDNKDVGSLLISHGAKVNARHKNGKTALHFSSVKGNVEFTKFLIEEGADINAVDHTVTHQCIASAKLANTEL